MRDFGATGDGVTDDTAAIQAAITAGGGHLVYLPRGTYVVTALTVANAGTIGGDGPGATILKATAATDIISITAADVTVRDLSVEKPANGTGGKGITSNAARTTVRNCRLYANSVELTGSKGLIEGCTFEAFPKRAVILAGAGYHRVIGNDIGNGMQYWLTADRSTPGGAIGGAVDITGDDCIVSSNFVHDIATNNPTGFPTGIFLYNVQRCVIDGNRVENVHCDGTLPIPNAGQGILVFNGSKNNVISNNVLRNCESEGITLYGRVGGTPLDVIHNTVSGNAVDDCRKNGIELYDTNGPNTVVGNTVTDIGSSIGAGVTVGTSRNGIHLYGASTKAPYTTIVGNECKGNYQNGIKVESSNFVTIADNTCNDNNRQRVTDGTSIWAGIYVSAGLTSSVTGNIATDTGGTKYQYYGLSLNGTTTVRYTANNFTGNLTEEILSPEKSLTNGLAKTFVPALQFGGGATGMTGTFTGRYTLQGNLVQVEIGITLTAKGSSTGAAVIDNLPFPEGGFTAVPAIVAFASNFTGLTGVVAAHLGGTSDQLTLQEWSATGTAAITNAKFTNTTSFRVTLTYQRA